MKRDDSDIRNRIVEFCRLMYERGYAPSRNGNVSALTDRDNILITPSSSCIGFLEPNDIVEVDRDGVKLDGSHEPSLELPFHLAVYRSREDARSVVHAHAPYISAFSVVGRVPSCDILPEFVVSVGKVGIVPFMMPGSRDLADRVFEEVREANALVLSNHGAITHGTDVEHAYMRMEDLENTARVQFFAERLGEIVHIGKKEIAILRSFEKGSGGK
ncbi:MAG: class II aldolase/adducin family protein [Candidatus Glassbacteria bacterium]